VSTDVVGRFSLNTAFEELKLQIASLMTVYNAIPADHPDRRKLAVRLSTLGIIKQGLDPKPKGTYLISRN
jgi:hypothetical protein